MHWKDANPPLRLITSPDEPLAAGACTAFGFKYQQGIVVAQRMQRFIYGGVGTARNKRHGTAVKDHASKEA